jgi:hypothetical protein
MDLITCLPKTDTNNDAIVVVVDKLSKMAHYIPTVTQITAKELADLFFKEIIRLHGVPESIISDRDPRFTSEFWRVLWEKLGTKLSMSTAHHPQSDGQTKWMNRTLEEGLRSYVNYHMTDWDQHLSALEFAYNNTVQESSGYSPFYLNTGQHPRIPLSVGSSSNMLVSDVLTQLSSDMEAAKESLRYAQQQQAKYANQHRVDTVYKQGDHVMLSTEHLNKGGRAPKLSSKFTGPFRIVKVLSDVAYELELPSSMRIHPVFHVSKLKAFKSDDGCFPDRVQQVRPPPEVIDGEEEYEISEIIDKRRRRVRGKEVVEYRIVWKGYPLAEATWEPQSNIEINGKEALWEFERIRRERGGEE